MPTLVERALRLWVEPVPDDDAALSAFRTVYTDPLDVNGAPTSLHALVDRARMLQGAIEGLQHQIDERCEAPGRRAFAFRLAGRHTGPLATPLGVVAPSGREVEMAGMDIFVVDEDADRVIGVWAVADFLGLLVQAGAVDLVTPG